MLIWTLISDFEASSSDVVVSWCWRYGWDVRVEGLQEGDCMVRKACLIRLISKLTFIMRTIRICSIGVWVRNRVATVASLSC